MKTPNRRDSHSAFTLFELVVVIAIVAVGFAMLASGMARSGPSVQAVLCLSSKRQLCQAWRMYSDDSNGKLTPNRDGGNAGKAQADAAWVAGWLDFSASPDNTNTEFLVNHAKYQWGAYLGPYLQSASVFKCPADQSVVSIGGTLMSRVRTVSMNNYVGDLSRTWTSPSKYQLSKKYFDILRPAQLFVFLDEREDSINDGNFESDPDTMWQLIDYPANYHGNAGSFVFADGHTELHRWRDPRTMPVLRPGQILPLNVNLPGDADVLWMAQHAAGVPTYP